jgi:hypothetical protein
VSRPRKPKPKPKPTLTAALALARTAAPEHPKAVAIQIGRLVAAKAMTVDAGLAFLLDASVDPALAGRSIVAASKAPAGPNAVMIALRKLIETPSTVKGRKAPKQPKAVDLFGKALPRRNTSELEDTVQARLAALLHKTARPGIMWFAIPNGGYRSPRTAARLKATGTRAGVPDLAFVIEGRTDFLELKRSKGGKLSPAQSAMKSEALGAGAIWALGRGFDDAVSVLQSWGVFEARTYSFPQVAA